MKRGKWILQVILAFMFANFAFADANEDREDARKKMKAYFTNVFYSMKNHHYSNSDVATENSETRNGSNLEQKIEHDLNENWFFKAFLIRVRPAFGFKLPGTWSLKIVPEAEVYWTQL